MKLKEKTNHWMRLKYVYILPLTVASLVTFAQPKTFVENTEVLDTGSLRITITQNKTDSIIPNKKDVDTTETEEIFGQYEVIPEFRGGPIAIQKFFRDNIKYPSEARNAKEEGQVLVTFTITKEGDIFNPKVTQGLSPALDAEAIRVISSMPKWYPGQSWGKPVDIECTLTVDFFLPPKELATILLNEGTDDERKVFTIIDKMPEFRGRKEGLLKFLQRSVKYPEKAKKSNTQGRVVAQFFINKKGKVDNIHIVKSVSPELDAEAIRVIKAMPKWKPGVYKGKVVSTEFTMPIQFKLSPSSPQRIN